MNIESKLNEYRGVEGFVCPAEFWPALGYGGEARYVAVWWEQLGDEAAWSDGRSSVVGAGWQAYLALVEGNFPAGHAARWLLGGSDLAATMRLVIDRMTEWAWLVPVDEAEDVLRRQWPAGEALVEDVLLEEWLAEIDEMAARQGESAVDPLRVGLEGWMAAVDASLARQHELDVAFVEAMRGRRRRRVSSDAFRG